MAIPAGNDVYIVSDMHLSEGWLPEQQRYSRLETFFYDGEFRNFVRAIIANSRARDSRATVVLNGDVFDFLAIVRVPNETTLDERGLQISGVEREFGLGTTEDKAIWKMERILAGHARFVLALAELVAAGHYLVVIRGNHDAELFWPGVQAEFRRAIVEKATEHGLMLRLETLDERMVFHQWFYYEPGRFYLEHGNQYEASNAFRYVLNPVLPPEYHPRRQMMLDYPMGSLFVRFLYNKMKLLDPFTTHFVTLEQYIRITYHHNFMDLFRTGTLHFPYFFRAIREARVFEEQGMAPVKQAHDEAMATLAEESGVGDKIEELQSLMSRPVGTTKYNVLKQMLRPVVRGGFTFLGITLASVLSWFYIFSLIQDSHWLSQGVLGKASLLAILAVVTVVGLFLGFSFVNRALHRSPDPTTGAMFSAAERISKLLGVPLVSMGHTHGVDLRPFEHDGYYSNSGTWIPHPGPWDTLTSKARQFTFVQIRGDEMQIRRWNDPANRWESVPLLEDYRPTTLERLLSEDSHPKESPRVSDET
ncbi:MAG: UDP-2,3-diacylglucosamine pyrophosphatase LpxH [Myxococcota bacterium]|jgi:UDP-2,3-diacylglucosamine pyrophosphatase LpxH